MYPRIFIIAAAFFLLASTAHADGFYLGIHAGVDLVQSTTPEFNQAYSGRNVEVSFSPGFRTDGVLGYQWGTLRFEGEFVYQHAVVDKLSLDGVTYSARGGIMGIGAMGNIWADIPNETIITPYVGGGAGFLNVEPSQIDVRVGDLTIPFSYRDDDYVFAWQLGAGFAVPVGDRFFFDLGYRFLTTSKLHLKLAKADCITHNIMVGLRYNFF
ncbi:MAG TPA: outer membrane beta-barrel protein [Geobacteraceae bacterium]|nr:outer membrane beta-barrel protein [Geobacteraceae bacterium]